MGNFELVTVLPFAATRIEGMSKSCDTEDRNLAFSLIYSGPGQNPPTNTLQRAIAQRHRQTVQRVIEKRKGYLSESKFFGDSPKRIPRFARVPQTGPSSVNRDAVKNIDRQSYSGQEKMPAELGDNFN